MRPFCYFNSMEETLQRQQYELAFHLLPSFEEKDLEGKRKEIEDLISEKGGVISRISEIKKIKLAYPIKREKFSNFGYLEFFAPKNTVEDMNKSLLLNENLLRHLIIKREEGRAAKPVKPFKPRIEKPKEIPMMPKMEEKETEELDKKIEEILEKL